MTCDKTMMFPGRLLMLIALRYGSEEGHYHAHAKLNVHETMVYVSYLTFQQQCDNPSIIYSY